MKRFGKAFVAFVLMLAMSLSLIPAYAAEQGEITVSFDNTAAWEEVYYYYWADGNNYLSSWPGEPAQLVGGSIYRAVLPEEAQYIIFHNNNGTQTNDLEIPGDGMIYLWASKTWENHVGCIHDWQNKVLVEPGCKTSGSVKRTCSICGQMVYDTLEELGHDYVAGVCTRCGRDTTSTITLYFDNTALWETVYCYYWTDNDSSLVSWPGEPATCLGSTVWMAEVPGAADYVIFNSTTGYQTKDLTIPGSGQIYTYFSEQWSVYNNCIHQWQETVVTEPDCTAEGASVKICSVCNKREETVMPPLGHAFEGDVCTRCGLDRTDTYTLYLLNDGFGWDTPYIYCWWDGGSDTWPGKPMEDLGDGLFAGQISAAATGVLFNDGQNVEQSYDLEVPGDGYVYNSLTGNWRVPGETYHIWDEGTFVVEPGCMNGGEIVYTCTLCGETSTSYIQAYGHEYENGNCIYCGMEQPDEYVLYLDTHGRVETPYVYYWSNQNSEMTLWPGEKMTHAGGDVYTAVVPVEADFVIFNSTESDFQTNNLVIPCNYGWFDLVYWDWVDFSGCFHQWDDGEMVEQGNCYTDSCMKYTCQGCGEYYYEDIEADGHNWENDQCIDCGLTRPESHVLYFDNADQWEQVYVYYWNSDHYEMIRWPGEKMTKLESGVYQCEIPGNAEYVVFSDGLDNGWQTFDLIIPDTGYLFKVNKGWVPYASSNLTISGTVTGSGDEDTVTGIFLWQEGELIDQQTASGTTAEYRFVDVAAGSYTLQVLRENHVDAEYTIVVEAEPVVQDVKLCYIGDVTGDGKVNMADVARAFAHVRGKNLITDDYTLHCADSTGDGKINMADIAKIFAHVRGKTKLF